MTRFELNPGGYERIVKKILLVQNAVVRGLLDPGAALRYLRMANSELFELRQTLDEVCLLTPDVPGHGDPDTA
jgi:hypothetical protein